MKIAVKLISIISMPFLVGIFMPESESASYSAHYADLNPDHIQGAFTGGFGEETCRSCHFDYDLNMDGGSLTVEGISESFSSETEYEIVVTVESEQLEVGGFQLTARHEDGSQAGTFDWSGDRLRFTPNIDGDVQYLQHSEEGTSPTGEREASWSFVWTPPESGNVIFNIAANAGNDDDSSFGDWIYAKEIVSKPEN